MAQQIINPVKLYHDFLPHKRNLKFSFRLIDTEETNLKNESSFGDDLISYINNKSIIVNWNIS